MEAAGGRGTEAGRGQNHEENNAQQLLGDKTWRLRGHKARRLTENNARRLRGGQNAEPPAAPSPEAGEGDEAGPPLGGPIPVAARGRRGGSSRCCRCRGDAARPRGMQAQGRGARRRGSAAGQGRKEPRAGTPTGTGTALGGAGGWSRGDGGAGVLRALRVPSARGGSRPQVAPSPSCPLSFRLF